MFEKYLRIGNCLMFGYSWIADCLESGSSIAGCFADNLAADSFAGYSPLVDSLMNPAHR